MPGVQGQKESIQTAPYLEGSTHFDIDTAEI